MNDIFVELKLEVVEVCGPALRPRSEITNKCFLVRGNLSLLYHTIFYTVLYVHHGTV